MSVVLRSVVLSLVALVASSGSARADDPRQLPRPTRLERPRPPSPYEPLKLPRTDIEDDPAHVPARRGFTLLVGAGGGVVRLAPASMPPVYTRGPAVDVAAGAWVSPNVGLLLHASGTWFTDGDRDHFDAFVGPAVHLAHRDAFVAVGAGLGALTDPDGSGLTERGLALDLRLGFDLLPRPGQALAFMVVASPAWYDSGPVQTFGARLGLQLF